MTTPTNEDLSRLLPEALAEAEKWRVPSDPARCAEVALDVLRSAITVARGTASELRWSDVRTLALQAAWLCLMLAWEAGQRMRHGPECLCAACDPPVKGTAASPPEPTNVDALLAHADALVRTGAHGNRVLAGVVAALRAERERARGAHTHLRTVLEWMWPAGTTGPACVREARAHLAGEAPPTTHHEYDLCDASKRLCAAVTLLSTHPAARDVTIAGQHADEAVRAVLDALAAERTAHAETKRMWSLGAANEARLQNEVDERKAMQAIGQRFADEAAAELAMVRAERDDLRVELDSERKSHAETRRYIQHERDNVMVTLRDAAVPTTNAAGAELSLCERVEQLVAMGGSEAERAAAAHAKIARLEDALRRIVTTVRAGQAAGAGATDAQVDECDAAIDAAEAILSPDQPMAEARR